jgi:hypothetical protein
LKTEQNGQQAADQRPHHPCEKELFGDSLMVLREDVARPEVSSVVLVLVTVVVVVGYVRVSVYICCCHFC